MPHSKGRLFVKGKSGNPAGRPKGIKDKRLVYREEIQKHLPIAIAKLAEAAENGDLTACKTLLQYAIPSIKPIEMPLETPLKLDQNAGLTDQMRQILAALSDGKLGIDGAAKLLSGLGAFVRTRDTLEIDDELRAAAEEMTALRAENVQLRKRLSELEGD